MKTYIKTREANKIVRSYKTSKIELADPWIEVTTSYSEDDVLRGDFLFAYENGAIGPTDIPRFQPAPFMQWNHDAGIWEDLRTLEQVKDDKWKEIKQAREAARFSPIAHKGNMYDANLLSQQNLQGAVQAAQLDGDLVFDWTLHDNAVITLTATQISELGLAVATRTSEMYAKARQLRTLIESANSIEDVSAITWDSL